MSPDDHSLNLRFFPSHCLSIVARPGLDTLLCCCPLSCQAILSHHLYSSRSSLQKAPVQTLLILRLILHSRLSSLVFSYSLPVLSSPGEFQAAMNKAWGNSWWLNNMWRGFSHTIPRQSHSLEWHYPWLFFGRAVSGMAARPTALETSGVASCQLPPVITERCFSSPPWASVLLMLGLMDNFPRLKSVNIPFFSRISLIIPLFVSRDYFWKFLLRSFQTLDPSGKNMSNI